MPGVFQGSGAAETEAFYECIVEIYISAPYGAEA